MVILLATVLRSTAIAGEVGDHLTPVDGYLSSYGHSHVYLTSVREILVRDAAKSPALMVTLPSFRAEKMVFIRSNQRDAQVSVVSATATEQIWSAEKKENIKVQQEERLIKPEIAGQIGAAFALATKQARYPKQERQGLDGVRYYFSSFVTGRGVTAGQTWSPDSQTPCGLLVALGEHMQGYVRGELTAEQLALEAQALIEVLKMND